VYYFIGREEEAARSSRTTGHIGTPPAKSIPAPATAQVGTPAVSNRSQQVKQAGLRDTGPFNLANRRGACSSSRFDHRGTCRASGWRSLPALQISRATVRVSASFQSRYRAKAQWCASRVRADAIARVTKRFAAMTLQIDSDKPKGAAANGILQRGPVTFEDDLSAMFQHSWKAARSASPSSINAMGVSLLWHDPRGSVLFGTMDRWERGKPRYKKIFASESLRLPAAPGGEWDFIHLADSFQLPTVGGTIFSPLQLLGFCELLAEAVEETAASVS
jgi:hypothetical protein